jgi:hypothetical protein
VAAIDHGVNTQNIRKESISVGLGSNRIEVEESGDHIFLRSDNPIPMASTEGLVPITRAFLSSYYDKHPFTPLSPDVSLLSSQLRTMATDLLTHHPPTHGFFLFISFFFNFIYLCIIHYYLLHIIYASLLDDNVEFMSFQEKAH